MKIYKFGGASIENAEGIRNITRIISGDDEMNTSIVISAIGKTTRKLENITELYLRKSDIVLSEIERIFATHKKICYELFSGSESAEIIKEIDSLKEDLLFFINHNKSPKEDFIYDQIVQYGELLSSKIVSEHLKSKGIKNKWLDARNMIKTNSKYRDAAVDWDLTVENIRKNVAGNTINITQGFIASDENNFSTTLGLEGSDYSAAILAYCLDAQNVTVWKDVEGILNADPRYFKNTTLLRHISFKEAIELSYFGATIIHPKTIQPLQHKEIPLYVKSFNDHKKEGTVITKGAVMEPLTPCYILKKDQILLSISALDFSFIVEENISDIFQLISVYKLKVNLIQNSAISFSIVLEDKYNSFNELIEILKNNYRIKYNSGVDLYTVRHYVDDHILEIEQNEKILLKQFSRETAQYVIK